MDRSQPGAHPEIDRGGPDELRDVRGERTGADEGRKGPRLLHELPDVQPDAAPRAAEGTRKPFVLLVDAVATKGREHVNLIDLPQVRRALQEVGEQAGGHWSCAEFGKGPGLLAAALDVELDAEPVSGFVAVDGATAEGRALLSVLTARADVVVRGVRS